MTKIKSNFSTIGEIFSTQVRPYDPITLSLKGVQDAAGPTPNFQNQTVTRKPNCSFHELQYSLPSPDLFSEEINRLADKIGNIESPVVINVKIQIIFLTHIRIRLHQPALNANYGLDRQTVSILLCQYIKNLTITNRTFLF